MSCHVIAIIFSGLVQAEEQGAIDIKRMIMATAVQIDQAAVSVCIAVAIFGDINV